MTSAPDTLVFDNPEKLKSILAKRGITWGFTGPITSEQTRDFQQVLAAHVSAATEIRQAPYRGSDRLFTLKRIKSLSFI